MRAISSQADSAVVSAARRVQNSDWRNSGELGVFTVEVIMRLLNAALVVLITVTGAFASGSAVARGGGGMGGGGHGFSGGGHGFVGGGHAFVGGGRAFVGGGKVFVGGRH